MILTKPSLYTGKPSSSSFHLIPIDPYLSTTLLLHCQPDFCKEVSEVILMKPSLCIGKLLSYDFHLILIDPYRSTILQMYYGSDLS